MRERCSKFRGNMYLLPDIVAARFEKFDKNRDSAMIYNYFGVFRCARSNICEGPSSLKLHTWDRKSS